MFVGQFITDLVVISVVFIKLKKLFEAKGKFLFKDTIYCSQIRILEMLTYVPKSEISIK